MNQINKPQREQEQIKKEEIKQELLKKERVRQALSQVREMIRRESRDLVTFAGDASIFYQASAEAKYFSYDPTENRIEVPALWFIEKGYSVEEIKFAFYHELGHFIDMRKNPLAYLKHFDRLEQEAIKVGALMRHILGEKSQGEPLPDQAIINDYAYQKLYTLYNIFDDIYVNELVRKRSPYYATAEGYGHVAGLYYKLGFKEENLKLHPKHQQLIYYLFISELKKGSADAIPVHPQVLTLINKKFLGRDLKEVVKESLTPQVGKLIDPEKRYQIVRHIIQPMYLDLLYEELRTRPFQAMIPAPGTPRGKTYLRDRSKGQDPRLDAAPDENKAQKEEFNPFHGSPRTDPEAEVISQKQIKNILEEFAKQDKYNTMSPID